MYPSHIQLDSFDCGPTCLKMVAEYYGRKYDLDYLREISYITREGVSLLGITQAAERIGFRTLMVKLDLDALEKECTLPAILHWNETHFIVLYNIRPRGSFWKFGGRDRTLFEVGDPAHGFVRLSREEFEKCWCPSGAGKGVALLLEPTSSFYSRATAQSSAGGLPFLTSYLRPFRKQIAMLVSYMLLSTAITISFPYLTKGLVDKGVLSKNYSWVLLFAISQLVLFCSSTILEALRSWLLLHMNARISLNIISDFLKKLLWLPISFFDSKGVGDVSQRINDHHRIETFLTGDLVNVFFSLLNVIIFSFILLTYGVGIWSVFIVLSAIAIVWISLFRKRRRKLDYIRFSRNRHSQEKLYELIVGMQEIKLYGSENAKRWEWEFLQQRLYKLNVKSLKLEQFQQTGFTFLTQLKNIVISYLAAVLVMEDKITFGTMLSISYIIGQTNSPLEQVFRFSKSAQDAKLSLSRLLEVQNRQNEESLVTGHSIPNMRSLARSIGDICVSHVSFQYQGPRSPYVLNDIDFSIRRGKVTAIIGASGSGKTTLMKLLLGFYQPVEGKIMIGKNDLSEFLPASWRSQCGTVMQDGYIFSDTIMRNIALDGEEVVRSRMKNAIDISNIDEFVKQLPMGYNTRIGSSGIGLSGGQKQRILIARAIYKNPNYLFFDEATSSLDANNESQIMEKLNLFFEGKTVVIIAHRLSTVKRADLIVVLEKGKIVETGNHESLTRAKGKYFGLVKNQLELGV
jgi:ATP-binding cassette, subfamily B, bacterial